MVDTLVLGTSAKAWEFESLHAHFLKRPSRVFFLLLTRTGNLILLKSIKNLRFTYKHLSKKYTGLNPHPAYQTHHPEP